MAGARQDYDLALRAYAPDGEVLGFLPEAYNIQVSYPLSEMPSLIFSYPKDVAMSKIFKWDQELEVAVVIWIESKGQWVEPAMSRFVVLQWEDDVTDDTNVIKFTCPGYAWLLSKQLIRKGKRDDALNAAEEARKEDVDSTKATMEAARRAQLSTVNRAKSILKYDGEVFSNSYFPDRVGKRQPKNKSVLYHAGRQAFYTYRSNTARWYRVGNAEVVDLIPTMRSQWNATVAAINAHNTAKANHKKAVYNAREATKNGQRPMVGTTAGWAIKRHYEESRSYGGQRLAGFSRSFNGTFATGRNSAGALHRRWPTKFDLDLTIGQSILDTLNQLTEMGMCEWRTRGRTLDLYRPGDLNVDMSRKVALHLGLDLTEAPDKATRHDYANWLLVRAENNLSFAMDQGADGRTGWGSWEKAVSVSGAEKTSTARKLALKEATEALKKIRLESTRGMIVRPDGPRPMYDFLPGHSIGVYGTDGKMNKVRVMQVTLTRDNRGYVTGNLVLGDRFMNRAIDFTRSLARTVGGYEKTIGGGTVPLLPAPLPPVEDPEAPLGLSVTGRAGIDPLTGNAGVVATATWSHDQAVPITAVPAELEPGEDTAPDE